jgi:hypothetical protein
MASSGETLERAMVLAPIAASRLSTPRVVTTNGITDASNAIGAGDLVGGDICGMLRRHA